MLFVIDFCGYLVIYNVNGPSFCTLIFKIAPRLSWYSGAGVSLNCVTVYQPQGFLTVSVRQLTDVSCQNYEILHTTFNFRPLLPLFISA